MSPRARRARCGRASCRSPVTLHLPPPSLGAASAVLALTISQLCTTNVLPACAAVATCCHCRLPWHDGAAVPTPLLCRPTQVQAHPCVETVQVTAGLPPSRPWRRRQPWWRHAPLRSAGLICATDWTFGVAAGAGCLALSTCWVPHPVHATEEQHLPLGRSPCARQRSSAGRRTGAVQGGGGLPSRANRNRRGGALPARRWCCKFSPSPSPPLRPSHAVLWLRSKS